MATFLLFLRWNGVNSQGRLQKISINDDNKTQQAIEAGRKMYP